MNDRKEYSWWPLFLTNFFSTFNDNLIKWLVIFVGVSWVSKGNDSTVISVASAMLVIPFILISPYAGKLSKLYEKKRIMVIGKFAEIPIMLIAIAGFYFQNLPTVMLAVLLMGTQSALFSPAKYGLIRDIKGVEGIPFGTGAMEMLTFVGVLLGTFFAGVLADYFRINILAIILLSVAVVGYIMSKLIKADESTPMSEAKGTMFFVNFIVKQFKLSKNFPGVNDAVFGLSMFWLIGALVQMNIKIYADYILFVDNKTQGLIMAIAAIGIAAGAILTGKLSGTKVRMGYVVFGSIGLAISQILIIVLVPELYGFMTLIFFTAFFAGFYKVPLNAYIQDRVKGRLLGDSLGYLNIMVFIFILFSAVIFELINRLSGNNSLWTFGFIALSSLFVGVYFFFKIRKDKYTSEKQSS